MPPGFIPVWPSLLPLCVYVIAVGQEIDLSDSFVAGVFL